MSMQDVVAITSGKGGAGKSTLSAAAGLYLSKTGKKVCLIDMDMGLRSLDIMLGLENRVVFDLADVAEGMCRIRQALIRHDAFENLSLLSAAQNRGSEAVNALQIKKVIAKLRDTFDVVLIDCPAGLGRGFRNAVSVCDRVVVVACPGAVELRDAERVMQVVKYMDLSVPSMVINRVRPEHMQDERIGVAAYQDRLRDMKVIGLIPEACPIDQSQEAQAAFEIAARNMLGENLPVKPVIRPSLMKRLLQAMRG